MFTTDQVHDLHIHDLGIELTQGDPEELDHGLICEQYE